MRLEACLCLTKMCASAILLSAVLAERSIFPTHAVSASP